MHKLLKPLIAAMLAISIILSNSTAFGSESGNDYRISGIMQLGANSYRALIEFTDGKKITVVSGDSLESWKIVGISDNCIVLSQADKQQEKCLTGSDDAPAKPDAVAAAQLEKARMRAQIEKNSPFKRVDKAEFLKILDKADKSQNMAELSQSLLKLAKMPTNQDLIRIGEQDLSSMTNPIDALRDSSDSAHGVKVTFSGENNQLSTFYIQPSQGGKGP